jgi:plasmid replication initiation protein
MLPERRRAMVRTILLDRSLEALPLFRLSDSSEDGAISFAPTGGGRWRVLPAPGDRLPGTFDQDVYIELLHRFHDAGLPDDGVVHFTLHDFLRSMGRRADGRTYELLRGALGRLERTSLESSNAYFDARAGVQLDGRFTLLTSIAIDRRRAGDRDQMTLFPALPAGEPGDARVTLAPIVRQNLAAGHRVVLSAAQYRALPSPVARRIYRLLEVAREQGMVTWRVPLERLAEQLPLAQRYPSHLQRVLQPAHEMLVAAGLARQITIKQHKRTWYVDYVLASRIP